MMEEIASDKLLNASAVTEMADVMIPAVNLAAKRKRFKIIPTIPVSIPYFLLTFSSEYEVLFFINI